MKSGIYCITNTTNGKEYIGSSKDMRGRWYVHKYNLRRGSHTNRHLQNAWNKDGELYFRFEVVEYCSVENLKDRETWWVSLLDLMCTDKGYNKISPDRYIVSEDTRLKMSIAHKGLVFSEEHRAHIASSNTVRNKSVEHRLKVSVSRKGVKQSPEHIAKLSATRKGRIPWNKK